MLLFYSLNFISKHIKAHKQSGAELYQAQQKQQLVYIVSFGNKLELNRYRFQCIDSKYLIFKTLKFDLQ